MAGIPVEKELSVKISFDKERFISMYAEEVSKLYCRIPPLTDKEIEDRKKTFMEENIMDYVSYDYEKVENN